MNLRQESPGRGRDRIGRSVDGDKSNKNLDCLRDSKEFRIARNREKPKRDDITDNGPPK